MEIFRFLDGGAVGLGTVQSPKAKGECREGQRNREQGAGRRDSVGVYVIFLISIFN